MDGDDLASCSTCPERNAADDEASVMAELYGDISTREQKEEGEAISGEEMLEISGSDAQ